MMKHGIETEPLIDEAYQLLTSNITEKSGLWFPDKNNSLHGLVAASPDRKVMMGRKLLGLCEYKAPVHCLYNPNCSIYGFPRKYMVQVQGQMAVCNASWCDFMAVCTRTKHIMLKRVLFNKTYWAAVSEKLQKFIQNLKVFISLTLFLNICC